MVRAMPQANLNFLYRKKKNIKAIQMFLKKKTS